MKLLSSVICVYFVQVLQFVSVFSQTIITPGNVVASRPFTLECRINRPSGNTDFLTWSLDLNTQTVILYDANTCTSSIPVSSSSPAGLSGGCHQDNGEEVYTVRIDNVTEDTGLVTWSCQYGFGQPVNATLDVKVMVTQVRVQNPPSTVLAGNNTTFTCVTSRSKPQACIRGYIRSSVNVRELGPTDCNQDSTYNPTTRITTRTLRFTPTAEDNGAALYCTADNSVTDPPVGSQYHTLDVQYPPVNGISLTSSYVNNTPIESETTMTLTCKVGKGNPRPVLTWTPECGQTNTSSGNDGSQQISISITASPSLNRKSCVCKGTQNGGLTGWSQQKSRMFNVFFGPDSVHLLSDSGQSGNTVRVTENSTVTFSCNSSESNPAVVLSWYNNNSPIPAAELSEVRSDRGPNLGHLITQRYTVRVDRYQDGNVIRCEARRSDQTTLVYPSTLTLDIIYAPRFTTCASSYILVENQTSADLSCSTWAKPDPRFTWSVRNQVLMDKTESGQDQRQTSVFTFNKVNRSNSGIYTVTVDNGVGRVQRNVNVTVYYAPDVNVVLVGNDTEGLSTMLECLADGRPGNYTYSVWTHRIGDRLVPLIDNTPGKYLTIPKLTFWHQGIYRCGVSNGFGGIHVGHSKEIKIKALPKFLSQDVIQTAALGENITLVIKFVSYPDYEAVMWHKTNQSSEMLSVSNTTGSKYRQYVREADHEFLINGTKILIPGHVAELRIHNVTREDFSQYRLTVTNNIGSSEGVINFRLIASELSEVMSERDPNLGHLITQRYTVRVDRYQDGNVIRCEARRSDQTTPVYSSTLTLDITLLQYVSVFSQTITPPGDVVAGRPFTLECRINRPSGNTEYLTWSHHLNTRTVILYDANTCTSSIPLTNEPSAGLSGGCHQDNGEEVYTVRIDSVTEDTGLVTWRCQYGFGQSVSVTLDVKVMVTQVRIQNPPSTVLAGTSTTFTCVTSRSKPRACIRCYLRSSGNVRELRPTDCNQDSTYTNTTRITTRTLRFTATAEDNGAVLYCTADNSVTDPPVRSQNHTLDVQYPPANGISLTSSYANNTPIEPGAIVTLTCQVGKGNPQPVLTWTPECGQTNTDSGNDGSQQISIRIVGPDSVQLLSDSGQSGNTVGVTEKSTVTFTCNSSESNPAAVLSWYNNSSPIPAAELSEVMSERDPNLGYLITQRYTVRVDRYQDGNVIRCEARRSDQTTPVYSSTLTLDITYAPWFTTCTASYILVENQTSADLSCSTWAKPNPRFTWSVRNQVLMNKTESGQDHRQTSVFTFNKVNRSNSGIYTVTVDNGVGRVQRNVNATVYHAPDVNVVLVGNDTEGLSTKLECRADGRPENYTYSVWTHHIGDRPVPLIDNNPGKYLTIPKLTFWHQGIYWCGVSNGFGGIHVGESTEINIKALPKFPSQDGIQTAALGENITLVIKFVSYPDYDKLMWFKNNQSSEILNVSNTTGSKYRLHVRESDHEFLINGIKILIPGHVAELRIYNVTREDFSQYRLTVTNNIGSSEDVVNFRLIDRPSAPTSIDCKNAKLEWNSGFDGGSMQTFLVEYNKDGGDWKDWRSNITDPGEGKSVNVEIDTLGEGQYRFRVYGVNRWNKSDAVEDSCEVIHVPVSSTQVAPIVAGVIVPVLLLICVTTIIFFVRRKRRENTNTGPPSPSVPINNATCTGNSGAGEYQSLNLSAQRSSGPVYENSVPSGHYQNSFEMGTGGAQTQDNNTHYEQLRVPREPVLEGNRIYENTVVG